VLQFSEVGKLISTGNLYTCLPIWAKFGTEHAYESPLRNCELRGDGPVKTVV